jgi:hypothetical protein
MVSFKRLNAGEVAEGTVWPLRIAGVFPVLLRRPDALHRVRHRADSRLLVVRPTSLFHTLVQYRRPRRPHGLPDPSAPAAAPGSGLPYVLIEALLCCSRITCPVSPMHMDEIRVPPPTVYPRREARRSCARARVLISHGASGRGLKRGADGPGSRRGRLTVGDGDAKRGSGGRHPPEPRPSHESGDAYLASIQASSRKRVLPAACEKTAPLTFLLRGTNVVPAYIGIMYALSMIILQAALTAA